MTGIAKLYVTPHRVTSAFKFLELVECWIRTNHEIKWGN